MIFVTVGTHEQQFNRLLKEIDTLKREGIIEDEVVMQTGFSDYEPQYCEWRKLIPYDEMNANIKQARIVITHGGPASFIAPLQIGKIPIVVPRQKQYEEHVNNHQVDFCKAVAERKKNIILVNNIRELKNNIVQYTKIVNTMQTDLEGNNKRFCIKLDELVNEIMQENITRI